MIWLAHTPDFDPADLGLLPSFLSEEDPRPAQEQLDANYPWGGYWRSDKASIDNKHRLCYPGEPPRDWLAAAVLRDEMILIYPGDFVVILQPDGAFKFQRMD